MKLRKKWKLGLGPIPQPISVLEAHGVKVIEVEEDPLLFDGTSNTVEGIPVLVLNKAEVITEDGKHLQNEERRRLTLFHELGHQVMHFSEGLSDKEKEDLCNVFANEMLIPSSTFRQIFGEKRASISYWELKDVQREFGISARALMMKAVQLGVISASKHKWFCINLNKNASLREALDKTAVQVQHTSRFDRLVYRSLDSELITHSKAAQLLGISLSKLKNNLNLNTANGYCS
jgi:Zn-dependent peptidase ImmA (M78 family)